ncbi:biopolymer transporter ExbD [Flavobacterium sp. xlx-214]|uniref:ExbD/TolR family protein n=1 Tax=unclassified Flavobacterium TaxID=196869 RepID=UPI0013CFC302|nr:MULTISPECIES: biopolymer transporter ExbD [unclassified Flavobacterium]MBA5792796.1 biopolymer transporter ExbD [Flavobacterium sp. xlx-221]QMI83933.1 biopolymer transporter ExbD [Flavobacterium sp. xlx-214]
MAELNTGGNEGKKGGKKVRSKKQNAGVDLTAMVDLAFLLITFFMLTTSLSKPQSMDLTLPDKLDKNDVPPQEAKESKTMTVLIGKDRKLKYYMGQFTAPYGGEGPIDQTYGKNGIRKIILQKMANLKAKGQIGKEGLVVLIKGTEEATYTDLIDILDEMAITGVEIYSLQDMTDAEKAIM